MLKVLYKNSFIGKKEENQDAFLVKYFDNGDKLLAVADGMGGGVMGAELAEQAIKMLDEDFSKSVKYSLSSKLEDLFYSINTKLKEMLDGKKGGTTLCMVYYTKSVIHYINIGDSRVWVCRDSKCINLTRDQNEYENKRLKNEYTDDEDKRFIFKILGMISTNFEIEEVLKSQYWSAFGSFKLQADDLLILSSDGFHDYIDESSFCDDFSHGFNSILMGVKERSTDNITAIITKEKS